NLRRLGNPMIRRFLVWLRNLIDTILWKMNKQRYILRYTSTTANHDWGYYFTSTHPPSYTTTNAWSNYPTTNDWINYS
ncbi:MAG: hypothetical protein Q6361_02370, partial [Candidatus Hermodarchaeota archaeon]|nr:hypothetical protein [Candidatus Hermodarchaeota archaeon]